MSHFINSYFIQIYMVNYSKPHQKRGAPMVKFLSLLFCLLLLGGCVAPAERGQAPAATEAAAATPVPTPDVTPSPTFTPRPTTFAAMHTPSPTYSGSGYRTPPPVPVQYFEPEEGEKILFSEAFSTYPIPSMDDALTLAGEPMTAAQLWDLAYSLADIPLRRLSDTLAEYGLETNYVAPLDEVTLNGTPSCMRILDDRYMYMCLWIPNNGKMGLFFRREGNMFVPLSMMDSAFDNTDVVNFLYFAGQPWMVYHINGHGTGFGVEHTYWFNIENGREELFYYDDFLLAETAGPDCYKMEQYGTLSYTPMEGPEDPYLSLIIRLELEAKYWDIAEGGDLLVAAPEPDLFMGQVKMNLYYDPDTCQFYVRIPLEAIPLAAWREIESMWRYYFGEELQTLLQEGDYFQQQWAATFFQYDGQ